MTDIPSPVDGQGRIKWSKLDIDLQGQNLMDDFSPLWRALQKARTNSTLTLEQLDELSVQCLSVKSAIENLRNRVCYVRRKPTIEWILEVLHRETVEHEQDRLVLDVLSDEELLRIRQYLESISSHGAIVVDIKDMSAIVATVQRRIK